MGNKNGQPKANGQQEERQQQQEDENNLEEFQRIVQLQQTKADETSNGSPIPQQIKIQLAKETWFDLLAFVPRRQLGQIVPQIGNRQFAGIAQSFLHNYGQITLGHIRICRPCDLDANGHPRLEVWPLFSKHLDDFWRTLSRELILPTADVPMPGNINDFLSLRISYLDTSVLNFLRLFRQNILFGNVNLQMMTKFNTSNRSFEPPATLPYVLPLIKDNINSILLGYFTQLGEFYNANNDTATDFLKMTRIVGICIENYQFEPEKIYLFTRWLYTPRDDNKPRMLILPNNMIIPHSSNLLHFIDNLKMEFSTAKTPCSFFIRFFVSDCDEWHHDTSMENAGTKEKLVVKKLALSDKQKLALRPQFKQKVALISRYPLNTSKEWIGANERDALDWDFDEQNRKIYLDNPNKNAMPPSFEHSFEGREAHYRSTRLSDCPSSATDGSEDQGGDKYFPLGAMGN